MKAWTTQAERRLAEYLIERAKREGFVGEDASELQEDLRRHIHEEAEHEAGDGIGLMQLEGILGRLDAGYRTPAWAADSPAAQQRGWRFWSWCAGVVMPLAILLFELLTRFCGGVFFDPVPTWMHVLLIALVPGLNAWLLRGGRGAGPFGKGVAAGITLVVAGFYGLLFVPILHFSIIGLLFLGMGLLSLTPILAAIQSWWIGRRMQREWPNPARFAQGRRLGMMAVVVALALLEGPGLWTRGNLLGAVDEGDGAAAAISRLRIYHSERALLKACYEGNRGTSMGTDIAGWIAGSWRIPAAMLGVSQFRQDNSEKARDVFFRVTGKPFNSLKPPPTTGGGALLGRADPLQEMEFDDHLGGDDVAVRLKALDLSESRFDGHIDSVSRIGYGEWTMVFKNGARVDREARCQVKLPVQGRVSRLSLWVNGEPREAAFSTVSKVKAAYQEVAVVQRRDPVLVTMVGPDTVMVQCFPVPAMGEMKIRLGVTAPLDECRWELPHIIERNFGASNKLEHAVWLQGDCGFELIGAGKPLASARDGAGQSLAAALAPEHAMGGGLAWVIDPLPATPEVVWCEDRFAKAEERYLIREPKSVTRPPATGRVVWVIDGSASLAEAKKWILKVADSFPPGECLILLADDTARQVTPKDLAAHRFSGGRDNEPALREAIRLTKANGNGPIVWLHGPQAVKLAQAEALLQSLERGAARPAIFEIEAVPGPNRLAEAIYRSGCLYRGPNMNHPADDLSGFLHDLGIERRAWSWNWTRAASVDSQSGKKVWDQLARLWAMTTADDGSANLSDEARSARAARYQVVTPLSGAVVLETEAQYERHGLTPADTSATPHVPTVPEPSTSLLLLLSTAAALLWRKREAWGDVLTSEAVPAPRAPDARLGDSSREMLLCLILAVAGALCFVMHGLL